jgi:hypothetical protein
MTKKLLAGVVVSTLALTPTVALAAGSHQQPSANAKNGGTAPGWQCFGYLYQCPGYRYMCRSEFSFGKAFGGFTNSDATEDYYEGLTIVTSAGVKVHTWVCYGD